MNNTKKLFILVIAMAVFGTGYMLKCNANKKSQEYVCQKGELQTVEKDGYYVGYYDSECIYHEHIQFNKPYISDKVERIKNFVRENGSQELLSKSEHSNYDFVDFMLASSHEYGIKYSVPICISFADSELGKNTKTKNNIGNVGNNDRGQTMSFESRGEGFIAILNTLNNKYLGQYNLIGELSGGGRIALGLPSCSESGIYCYASSEVNWRNNVLNCLTYLEGQEIRDDFSFRL